ncbi:MAG: flagellar protein export ATPase FliI [Bacilli bacterium]
MLNSELFKEAIKHQPSVKRYGYVRRIVGLLIESKGPFAKLGTICYIHTQDNEKIMAEIVGFQQSFILLMPYTEVKDIAPGALVEATDGPLVVHAGDGLIGKVVDAIGRPLDTPEIQYGHISMPADANPPNPMTRPPVHDPMYVGVKMIDSFLTMGRGQRVGIFAGSGVGKSTLMGMIARNAESDVNVIALIGERGREVREFIERDLGEEGLKRSVVVVATSDQPALLRLKAAYTATAIAEYFRGNGKDVMLMMDSVTRVAMAQREIGLAIGEPPTTKGYTPSVFAILPRLLERAGTDEHGSITAFYNVLVDGDDMNEPIADTCRGILDGHIVLDRKLAHKGQYPAINVLSSISRCMNGIADGEHRRLNNVFRNLLSTYNTNEDLINIGAYKRGASATIDEAIDLHPALVNYMMQAFDENVPFDIGFAQLQQLLANVRSVS